MVGTGWLVDSRRFRIRAYFGFERTGVVSRGVVCFVVFTKIAVVFVSVVFLVPVVFVAVVVGALAVIVFFVVEGGRGDKGVFEGRGGAFDGIFRLAIEFLDLAKRASRRRTGFVDVLLDFAVELADRSHKPWQVFRANKQDHRDQQDKRFM